MSVFMTMILLITKLGLPSMEPRVLKADGADAIRNAFKATFNCEKHDMCWAHIRRFVDKKLSLIDELDDRDEVIADIDLIQLSQTNEIFDKAINIFIKKWIKEKDFIEYFKKEWFDSHPEWYEGYAVNCLSTNNNLESTNRYIKEFTTIRERHGKSTFTKLSEKMLKR